MKLNALIVLIVVLSLFGFSLADETFVAVLETISPEKAVNLDTKLYLTDKLRERASLILPAYMGFTIMTRENINAMLPPGKKIEDCEGQCLAETGRNIAANYIAQARVGRFGEMFTLTVELYETRSNKLLGSFTDRTRNAEGLLKVIELQADALFLKVQSDKDNGFISNKSFSKKKVHVSTVPQGALLSVDGKPLKSCKKTPCEIELPVGNHRFSFVLDEYFDKDTVYEIESASRNFVMSLVPNFGVLHVNPIYDEAVGRKEDLRVEIDGVEQRKSEFRLSIGSHKVKLSHPCYEIVTFDVGLKSGTFAKFERNLKPIYAGLSLSVIAGNEPQEVPVYVGKHKLGVTPFLGEIPACADVKIKYDGRTQSVGVRLKPGEYVGYQYDVDDGGKIEFREMAE